MHDEYAATRYIGDFYAEHGNGNLAKQRLIISRLIASRRISQFDFRAFPVIILILRRRGYLCTQNFEYIILTNDCSFFPICQEINKKN